MAAQSWTLKAELQGERRRLRDWVPVGEEPTLEAVRTGASRLFEITEPPVQGLIFQYQDNEGDLCTLTELTLSDALCLCVESRTLRVMVSTAPPTDQAENLPGQFRDQIDRVRTGLDGGGARLRTSVEQLKTHVSSSLEDGRVRVHAQVEQFGASIQDSGSSLRAGAEQLGTHIQTGNARMRSTFEQVGSEIQSNLQEGRDGVRVRSKQLKEDLCDGCSQFHQSFNNSVEGRSKTRVASAIVAGGATLVVTRNFTAAISVGALAAGASAAAARVIATPAQEEPLAESPVEQPIEPEVSMNGEIAGATVELSAFAAGELSTVPAFPDAPLEGSQSAVQDDSFVHVVASLQGSEQEVEDEEEQEQEQDKDDEENSMVMVASGK